MKRKIVVDVTLILVHFLYSKPETVEQAVETVVERILNLAGFDIDSLRWGTPKI